MPDRIFSNEDVPGIDSLIVYPETNTVAYGIVVEKTDDKLSDACGLMLEWLEEKGYLDARR